MKELETLIKEKTKVVEDMTTHNNELQTDYMKEDAIHRRQAQTAAALDAKLKFIQDKYDMTSNVRGLKLEELAQLENSNVMVSFSSINCDRSKTRCTDSERNWISQRKVLRCMMHLASTPLLSENMRIIYFNHHVLLLPKYSSMLFPIFLEY